MIQEKKLPAWIVGKGLTHSEPPVCKTVIPQFPECTVDFLPLPVRMSFGDQLPAFDPAAFFGLDPELQCHNASFARNVSEKIHAAVRDPLTRIHPFDQERGEKSHQLGWSDQKTQPGKSCILRKGLGFGCPVRWLLQDHFSTQGVLIWLSARNAAACPRN